MEDVVNKRCAHQGCKTKPCYNNSGEKLGLYCSGHKFDGMVDVVNKMCANTGCKTKPSYNNPGEKVRLYCLEHKLSGMEDIVSKRCANQGCKKRPCCNKPGERIGLYCLGHKLAGMENVVSKRCANPGCKKISLYNEIGKKLRLYCSDHKIDGMIDVVHKKCAFCNNVLANPKYDYYCVRCYIHLNPDSPIIRNYKVKEKWVLDTLQEYLPTDIKVTRDKPISNGCSKRRPDLMIDCFSHWICVENDENCHKDYDTTCENKRINELYTDMGDRPMVLIRFNCDSYTDSIMKHESLFKICKRTGMCIKRNEPQFNKRIEKLAETVKSYLKEQPHEIITTEYLFYDN